MQDQQRGAQNSKATRKKKSTQRKTDRAIKRVTHAGGGQGGDLWGRDKIET